MEGAMLTQEINTPSTTISDRWNIEITYDDGSGEVSENVTSSDKLGYYRTVAQARLVYTQRTTLLAVTMELPTMLAVKVV